MFDLTGRVIIVTGAGRAIGRATSLALARQGASLMLTDINAASAEETAELAVAASPARTESLSMGHDVSAEADWDRVLDRVRVTWGRLDALVNNAGIMITTPLAEIPLADFRRQLDVNAVGTFIGSQRAVPLMIETASKHGVKPSIVNLSSLYAQIAGPSHVGYSASKGAIRSMTKSIAVEVAPHGIRVNSVHPGPVRTGILVEAVESLAAHGQMPGGEKGLTAVAKKHPMGRNAEPEDIAGVIVFLCTDASSFMTGAELTVDGGYGLL